MEITAGPLIGPAIGDYFNALLACRVKKIASVQFSTSIFGRFSGPT